tara:strand:- start:4355 stop:5332 length:978 start_codon:yes stop_codon:yes gene_type:complete
MPSLRICHHNTQGLVNDFLILKCALQSSFDIEHSVYSEVALVKNETVKDIGNCDVNIFLEHIYEDFIQYAKKNVFIPNIEWFNTSDVSLIKHIDTICCKNDHSYKILKSKFPESIILNTGFTSIDRFNQSIPKKHDYFLHLKGISNYKNSQVLVDTWLKHPEWPTLVVVHHGNHQTRGTLHFAIPFKVSKNIIVYQSKLNDEALKSIMNQCGVHICCSFSEGFGHYINEARSTGAYLITTDGYPMKDFLKNQECGRLITPNKRVPLNFGEGYIIDSFAIERIINSLIHLPGKILLKNGEKNRTNFLRDRDVFLTCVQKLFKSMSQ